jgi:glycogen debranching enzyme
MIRRLLLASLLPCILSCAPPQAPNSPLENLKILIPREANRAVSFTNKEAAYYYTQTHLPDHPEHTWFEGMNVAKNRMFGGYRLFADQQELDNQYSNVTVFPHKMVRNHGRLTEELWMLDYRNVIEVNLTGAKETIGIALKGQGVNLKRQTPTTAFFASMEGNFSIAVSAKSLEPIQLTENTVSAPARAGGFYISVARSDSAAEAVLIDTQEKIISLKNSRVQRMEQFMTHNAFMKSNLDSLNLAMNWLNATMDQLVTKQQGDGIYAGLPWFNEYWGRDEFIAFPGAMLVSGQFETGRKILSSFAEYQNKDQTSKFFGRVPNIVNPSNIDYHTTDGTPRFIIAMQDYVKYSGDTSMIRELYPAVIHSLQGALKNWVDGKGYLLHEDNETWMDARDANLVSYSPRSTRANDIQALWHHQLLAGAYFAGYMKDTANRAAWITLANTLKENFKHDYQDTGHEWLADRLTKENEADFTLRPNQLFAWDMLDDPTFKAKALKKTWEELVYPWGVATLDRHHPFFHPFHLTPEYHKDAAYHNGAIWPWLNGIAMQRMIEFGQVETAYTLFRNMNRQALTRGVVGGLSENLDAYPRPGEALPKLTGTYLQAWSNSEQLRTWNQWFLGIRPDLANNTVILAPRIPEEITELEYRSLIGGGQLVAGYARSKTPTHTYRFENLPILAIIVDIHPYDVAMLDVGPGCLLEIMQTEESLTITLSEQDRITKKIRLTRSPDRIRLQALHDEILGGVKFAEPRDPLDHPVMGINR